MPKLTSSWQAPQTTLLGLVFQLSAWVAPLAWQVVQLRMSCGKTTVEKSDHWPRCQMRLAIRAVTLGRLDPIDFVDQDLGILRDLGVGIDGLRSMAEDAKFHCQARSTVAESAGRGTDCKRQAVTTERVTATGFALGTKLKTSLQVSLHSSNVPNSDKFLRAETPMGWDRKVAGALVLNEYA